MLFDNRFLNINNTLSIPEDISERKIWRCMCNRKYILFSKSALQKLAILKVYIVAKCSENNMLYMAELVLFNSKLCPSQGTNKTFDICRHH